MKKNKDNAAELLAALAAGTITAQEFKAQAQAFKRKAFLFKHPGNKYTLQPWADEADAAPEEMEVTPEELPRLREQFYIVGIIRHSGIPPVLNEADLPEPIE